MAVPVRRPPAPEPRLRRPGIRTLAWLGLAAAGLLAYAAWQRRVVGIALPGAIPDTLRGAAAAAALFFACGYSLARVWTPAALRAHATLLSFPVGAVASALALTALGIARVPFIPALVAVVAVGITSAVLVRLRRGPLRNELPEGERPGGVLRVAAPSYVAVLIAAVALSPMLRTGFATVLGQNGDAVLAVGSAELVKHAPPTAIREELPVDRIPLAWRSKVPIFYSLAAVSALSGLGVIQAFSILCAAVVAMAAFGFGLFARAALRAPPLVALAVMGAVALDRIVLYVTMHPFYNQLWALFALPFVLLAGWAYVRAPSRGSLGLLALFGAAGAFAYPLMLPFPLLFIAVAAGMRWREARAAGTYPGFVSALRLRRAPVWAWAPLGVLGLVLAAVLVRGVGEKAIGGLIALSPWGSLDAWSGPALGYLATPRFFGIPGTSLLSYLGVAAVLAAAVWGLSHSPRDAALPLGVTLAGALGFGIYFRYRDQAQLFYFKDMSFAGPLVVMCAVVGIGAAAARLRDAGGRARPGALAAAGGLAALFLALAWGAHREVRTTYEYASRSVLDMGEWADRLPPGSSIRIDIPPSGYQLWAQYLLADHPLSASNPLVGFFPYPPFGRRADYVIAEVMQPRPPDAAGAARFENAQFRLWRMRPGVPGPDVSSRRMVDSVTEVNLL